jgi:hypothetical protein
VYLFGCESLNPDAANYSSAYGESGRDRMRRIFANVPAIYGFSSHAPVGPTAAMLLGRYFASSSPGEIFTGRPSPRLLSIFSRNSMIVISGSRDNPQRRDICQFYNDNVDAPKKVAFVHEVLRRDMTEVRPYFERIEKLLGSFSDEDRKSPELAAALHAIGEDRPARDRYLAYERRVRDATLRARMIAVARTFGWLTPDENRAEIVAMINDVIASPMGFVEVDLVCGLNDDRSLDRELGNIKLPAARASRVSHAAVLACLGSGDAHSQVMRALATGDDQDVAAVQAYLKHRPPPREELRAVALDIAKRAGNGVSVRALDALGRFNIADREVLEELVRSFTSAKSANVQRAIAEVFIRADPKAIPRVELAAALREHRLKPHDDLVEVLLRRLQS